MAQRADENAITAAEDAFGTTVGNETIGLYSPFSARGFSPTQAGNVRIDGLYFDQQTELNNRVKSGSTVRVGISAQSYAFPAPTGIADYSLRLPGDKQMTSVFLGAGPFQAYYGEVDAQVPVMKDKLSVGVGVGLSQDSFDWGANSLYSSYGLIARWRPTDSIEITPFWSRSDTYDWETKPFVYTAGPYLPPKFIRGLFFGQPWTEWRQVDSNYGVLGAARLGQDWRIRAGVFRSSQTLLNSYFDQYFNTQPDGVADHNVFVYPRQKYASTSGEARAERIIAEGPRRHTLILALRGRDVRRDFGGSAVVSYGPATIGVPNFQPKPNPAFGPLSHDHATQGTAGLSYQGIWPGVGEMSFGVQKTRYHRAIQQPLLPRASVTSTPWLYNGTLTVYASQKLAFYAGYTRGLEESGIAPSNASNRGEALPASLTKQFDAGFRYALTPRLKLVAGVYQVEKPYFNVDPLAANLFHDLGIVRHRGVEMSLAGQVIDGLTVVAGMEILRPRITSAGTTTRRIPVGVIPRHIIANVIYGPQEWDGFSVDIGFENIPTRTANFANTFELPRRSVLHLGARYKFELFGAPASLRGQVLNVANVFGWNVDSAGTFSPNAKRRYLATFAVDL